MKSEPSTKERQYVILPVPTADSYPMYQIHILLGENPIPFHIGNKPLIYKEYEQAKANVFLLIKYSNSFSTEIYDKYSVSFQGNEILVTDTDLLIVKDKYQIIGLENIEESLVAKSTN